MFFKWSEIKLQVGLETFSRLKERKSGVSLGMEGGKEGGKEGGEELAI